MNMDGIGENSQLNEVKTENDTMQKGMLALQVEVSSLRSELAKYKKVKEIRTATTTEEVKTENKKAKFVVDEKKKAAVEATLLVEEEKKKAAVEDESAAKAKSAEAERKRLTKGVETTSQAKREVVRKKLRKRGLLKKLKWEPRK